jgi:hypothetical protein
MKIKQFNCISTNKWTPQLEANSNVQLLLVFAAPNIFQDKHRFKELLNVFPNAGIMGCSTSGEIMGQNVQDDTMIVTAIEFEKTQIEFSQVLLNEAADSHICGKNLINQLAKKDLKHVLVLSDGLHVNGSELVKGMRESLPVGITVTGGLAGDGADFKNTYVLSRNGDVMEKAITAVGFYGDAIHVSYGSYGGWDPFGVERKVTSSKANVLYSIDNQPALELYKSFLGENAQHLPSSGLLFPLSLRTKEDEQPVVRTILAINEAEQSITFAGDLPEGSYVRLMKANTERLIQGAIKAAEITSKGMKADHADLAILVSCVGRKLVLKQLVEEEVEGVHRLLGEGCHSTGFYSYGEIAPFSDNAACELHNQTMTLTVLSEN